MILREIDLVIFVLVLARVSAFIAFFPLFSQKQLPNLVKAGLALALTLFWFGTVSNSFQGGISADVGLIESVVLLFKELTIGIVLAILLGLLFLPAKIAGSYLGQELGLSLAAISDPSAQDSSTLISRIFEALATLLFFVLDLHHFVILSIHVSFEYLFGRINLTQLPTEEIAGTVNQVSAFGLQSIGPCVILLMLITVSLALLNKAAPSLNLFSVGMSFRTGFGILCLLISFPILMATTKGYLYQMQQDIEMILEKLY